MAERRRHIVVWMLPAKAEDIIRLVHALVPVMKLRNWDETTSEGILKAFAIDLADQPFFAIQDACLAFRRNLVGDGWMPTPGDLLVETKHKSEWLRKEAVEIDRILEAEIVEERPAPERASVRDRTDALLREIKGARPPNEVARGFVAERAEEVSPMERLEALAKAYRDAPVTLSNDARSAGRRVAA